MNPLAVLSRGYAAVRSADGKNVITDAAGLSAGDRIDLAMRDGNVLAVVEKTEKKTEG